MSRKIFLDGELGDKFGPVFKFSGTTVQEAFRCIEANRPDFRKYLIECQERDIGFHVEVQGTEISTPLECLLPLRNGDIIITPVVAGSKSGGAKIVAAIALGFLSMGLSNLVYAQQIAMLSGAGSTGLATTLGYAATAASTLAVNLAITGVQQLMAPDPATDSAPEENYLFNGSQQTIVEGMPVPVLYGELRVPGYPVSFEIVKGDKTVTSTDSYVDESGNMIVSSWQESSLEMSSNSDVYSNPLSYSNSMESLSYNNTQTILFTDIISEGPIYGLVNGGSSVYLNDDPAQTTAQSLTRLSDTAVSFTFTNSSTAVTVNKNNQAKEITIDGSASTYLVVRNYFSASGSAINWTGIGTTIGIKVTSSTSLFTAGMVWDRNNTSIIPSIRLQDGNGETIFEGYIDSITSDTIANCVPLANRNISPAFVSGATYSILIDAKLQISSIAENQESLVLSVGFPGATGTYQCDLTSANYLPLEVGDYVAEGAKYSNFGVQFRTGELLQPPFTDVGGTGIGNISLGPGGSFSATPLVYNETTPATPRVFTGSSADGFGLSAAQVEEVDEVRLTFTYPQFWNKSETGKMNTATARYNLSLEVYKDASWGEAFPIKSIVHGGATNSSVLFEEIINLQDYKPFDDFRVTVTRTTYEDKAYNWNTNTTNPNYTTASSSSITSLNSIIKEPLSYPYTAMAKTMVNSRNFSGVPSRTYHCKGMKVQVPSNYVTRDESSTGQATYTRNVSTGSIEASYQDWDGNFRSKRVYTNNPAWVFYDMLTNNRYGLGTWLDAVDIDKYALYRIARYCDELVPYGTDSTVEPRFTTNVYLTKSTDAYKVLKDLATVFRGMLYWLDGQMVPIVDQASDPIYNFTAGNIIEGQFTYESTGSKTRSNQIVVTWNNPDSNYRLENIIVEDRENIISTGKIISEEAAAFGATSEGQAIRYGRWKLWTARNQTEIVSFKTAINAAFLAPGDIINVQDSNRYHTNIQYSGRISSTGTLTSTTIPLDRAIELNVGSTYELSVLIEEPGTFLAQTSATINSVNYVRGNLITGTFTKEEASNLVDDSGALVATVWKPHTRVESKAVSTAAGTGISSLTVSSAFSSAPSIQTIWALKELVDSYEVIGSKKMYKILAISEESKNTYSITGVEHYNEKYDAVDLEFVLAIQDPVYPIAKAGDEVPAPPAVYVVVNDLDSGNLLNDATVYWDTPLVNGQIYPDIAEYELIHNFEAYPNPLKLSKAQTSVPGLNLPIGTHTIGIRTISTQGKLSTTTKSSFTIENIPLQSISRYRGIPLGGVISTTAFVTAEGIFSLNSANYAFSPAGNPTLINTYNSELVNTYIQDCSDIPSINYSALSSAEIRQLAASYIFIDSSDPSDPLKLVKYYDDPILGLRYLYDTGIGNQAPSTNFSTQSGTVSVASGALKVVGIGTSFTTQYVVGDIIKFGTDKAAIVVYIASNTDLRIDRSFTTSIAGVAHAKSLFTYDMNDDAIIAQVRNNNGTFEYYPVNLVINPDLNNSGLSVVLQTTPSLLNFDATSSLTTTYDNIVLTASSLLFTNPEFRITGQGFDNAQISQIAETVFSPATTAPNIYTKTLDKVSTFTTTDLVFTVEVREANDPTNTNKQATSTITIPFIKDGAAGAAGADGADGVDGDTGPRNAQVYFFYNTAQDSAPTAPTTAQVSYNFSTQTASISASGWSTTFNPSALSGDDTGENKYWAVKVVFQENSYNGSYSETISSVFTWMNFDGLVTFTNLANGTNVDGVDTTFIDGGSIITNTLEVNTIKSGTNAQNTDHEFGFATDGIEVNGSAYDTTGLFITSDSDTCIAVTAVSEATSGSTSSGLAAASRTSPSAYFFYDSEGTWSTASSDSWVYLSSSTRLIAAGAGGSSEKFYVDTSGNVVAAGNVTAYSDARLKENLEVIPNALDKVVSLTGYTFDRTDLNIRQTGLIAQDVQKVLPEAVNEGEYLGLNYGSLVGLLVEAIKDLKAEIEELKRDTSK